MVIVSIEFKRIQSFLFLVPRFRAALGANRLLGRVIRRDLPGLVDVVNKDFGLAPPSIEATITHPTFAEEVVDPLSKAAGTRVDDPMALYKRGVLSRDGGHFKAVFGGTKAAKEFLKRASRLLEKSLPGLRFELEMHGRRVTLDEITSGHSSTRLPQFELCRDTGDRVANQKVNRSNEQAGDADDQRPVSDLVGLMMEEGRKLANHAQHDAWDVVSLMQPNLALADWKTARDFEQLAGPSGYLALVHADGNAIGHRVRKWRAHCVDQFPGGAKPDPVELEACIESFFWAMRLALRASVAEATKQVYGHIKGAKNSVRPFQILMLGGDDLLILCRPEHVFDLLVVLERELKEYTLPDGAPLSLGIGVSIAKHTLPFYLMSELAETLAASAKQRYRREGMERSIVDWNIASSSWVDGVLQQRRRIADQPDPTRPTLRTLRPYPVIDSTVSQPDLAALLNVAKEVRERLEEDCSDRLSRAKLKRLAAVLFDSPEQGAAYYQRFFHDENSGGNNVLHRILPEQWLDKDKPSPWMNVERARVTYLLDLIELVELRFLGRQARRSRHAESVAVGDME